MNTVIFDLLNAQPIGGTKFHGGGEYIKSVFEALAMRYDSTYRLEVCFNKSKFLDDWILNLIKEKNIIAHNVATARDIKDILWKIEIKDSVRFFTGMIYSYKDAEFPKEVITIGVCHGLREIEMPYDREAWRYVSSKAELRECIGRTLFPRRGIRKSKEASSNLFGNFNIVITDSEHSAYSIKVNFPEEIKRTDIKVYYAPSKYAQLPETKKTSNVQYIMMISANRWLKNSYRGVVAIDRLYQSGYLQNVKTRVYGKMSKRVQSQIKCCENFEFYDYVPTEELEEAYRDCEIFFYPTLNEGFGLPPLEAMKYGKTCVVSAICSLPEVYGESVYYFNPYDIMEMKNRILRALEEKIPAQIINKQMCKIFSKQKTDLDELCKIIVGEK